MYIRYIYVTYIYTYHSHIALHFFFSPTHTRLTRRSYTLSYKGSRGAFLSPGVKLPRVTSIPRPPLPHTPLLSSVQEKLYVYHYLRNQKAGLHWSS